MAKKNQFGAYNKEVLKRFTDRRILEKFQMQMGLGR